MITVIYKSQKTFTDKYQIKRTQNVQMRVCFNVTDILLLINNDFDYIYSAYVQSCDIYNKVEVQRDIWIKQFL